MMEEKKLEHIHQNNDNFSWMLILPAEIQYVILKKLRAKDLCSVGCVCRALRSVSLDDILWREICTDSNWRVIFCFIHLLSLSF